LQLWWKYLWWKYLHVGDRWLQAARRWRVLEARAGIDAMSAMNATLATTILRMTRAAAVSKR